MAGLKRVLAILALTLVLFQASSSGAAETWCIFHYYNTNVYDYPGGHIISTNPDPGGPEGSAFYGGGSDWYSGNPIEFYPSYGFYPPHYIAFTFDGRSMRLNSLDVSTVGGSSQKRWTLYVNGLWAVCGTTSGGVWTPDPYATFAANSYGGTITWKAGTPKGYQTTLHLGDSFGGDGAVTYTNWTQGQPGASVTGTLIFGVSYPFMGSGYYARFARVYSHEFTVTYIPEPCGLLALLAGMGLVGYRLRRVIAQQPADPVPTARRL